MASDDGHFDQAKRFLAANIAGLRSRRGWSQQQLADAAALDVKHVQKLEYGDLNPSLRTIARLAGAFGVPLGKLLAETSARPPSRPVGRPRHTRR